MEPFAKNVVPILIQDEMKSSYMDYSMSVIIGRALPDVRDGLKPVHRRILYAMHQMGLTSSKRYSKCAGTVGEVLKKFHPHGDSAVYDALVRMAQPWNLRYPLVDGQGNFGSVDGDPAAAYRYTEARMTRLAEELLVDIEKETVSFSANFDGTTEEPDVLPCRFPNLLVNGADGIAVGMATKIPPHNLGEVVDACLALIEDPTLTVIDLMQYIPAPDFPTAGTIYGRKGVHDAYTTGRGRVVIRGRADFEEVHGRQAIVIDEIPYQVNKSRLIENVADLVKDRRIDGIHAIRDESDRQGMRIVIELKKDAFGEVVLNHLYKHTALQTTFGVILLSIVNQRPRILTLKEMLQHFISHRREVILRRTRFELRKARERAHVLEGFLKALDLIDEIIKLIRASATVGEAREGLVTRFGFTEIQAQAILEMRLQRLTGMERQKIEDEYGQLQLRIAEYVEILGSEVTLMNVVRGELHEIREAYADDRRTRIVDAIGELTMHDLVAEEDQVVTLSHLGYIKRCSPDEWSTQRRGGMGKRGMATRAADFVTSLFIANTHDLLLVFTNKGRVFPLHVYDVPETSRNGKGRPIVNLVAMPDGERVAAVVTVREVDQEEKQLLFVSKQGLVKRTPLRSFRNLRQGGMWAAGVRDDDELLAVRVVEGDSHVILFTRGAKCIRFPLTQVPLSGRTAQGNKGIVLDPFDGEGGDAEDDIVVDVVVAAGDVLVTDDELEDDVEEEVATDGGDLEDEEELEEPAERTLVTVSELGYGKRNFFAAFRAQNRYGKGLKSFDVERPEVTGFVVGAVEVSTDDQLMLVTDTGRVIRLSAADVRLTKGRIVRGVRLMRLEDGERIVDVARLEEPVDEDEDDELEEGVEGEEGGDLDESGDAPDGPDVPNAPGIDGDDPGSDE